MAKEELTNAFKYIVKKCDMLINNNDYEADAYTQDTVEDIAELCNHILDGDYGKLVELKEVNLEKEIDDYMAKELEGIEGIEENKFLYDMVKTELSDIARHFFELGLKVAQKGE